MRIRNKNTGEIKTIVVPTGIENLFEEWEEASKSMYYYITDDGEIESEYMYPESPEDRRRKEFGNYFETQEAVEYAYSDIKKLLTYGEIRDV